MEELKKCPFCGKTETLEFTNCRDEEECANFESCECDPYICVTCNVNTGGCGASGGYAPSEEEAAANWNRRPTPKNKPLIDELHSILDFADQCRTKDKNMSELAISNGLALGKIAVLIGHDYSVKPEADAK